MIEIILKFYGINCNNKWIRFFATGLTLSVFLTTIFMLNPVKSSEDLTREIFFKIIILIFIASKLFNYLMIKYNSTEIFELNLRLRKFQDKCLISQLNIKIIAIFSIFFSILSAFITTIVYFYEPDMTEILEDFNESMDSLPIPSYLQIFIQSFYYHSWFILVQLLYLEFKTRYISILKEFRKNVINEKSEPDSDVLVLTQKYVIKFVNFKNDIKRNLDFLKYGISMEFVSTVTLIVYFHVLTSKSKSYYLGILFLILFIGCYLWTMSSNLRIRIIENDISFILNQWLRLNPEDSIRIEMDYIQKSVKLSDDKKFKDKTNNK